MISSCREERWLEAFGCSDRLNVCQTPKALRIGNLIAGVAVVHTMSYSSNGSMLRPGLDALCTVRISVLRVMTRYPWGRAVG